MSDRGKSFNEMLLLQGRPRKARVQLELGHPLLLDRSDFEFRLEPSRLLRTACYAFHFTRVLLAPGWE